MQRRSSAFAALVFGFSVLSQVAAAAAVQRTFVASTGNDANPCSLVLPCRGFAAAAAQTDFNGEVVVLDSAGYGPVTITRGVKVIAPAGVFAGVSVIAGEGIVIDGGASAIDVVLRGLTVNGQGGAIGIHFVHGGTLHVEHCEVSSFYAGTGIEVDAPGSGVYVDDSLIHENKNGIVLGALVAADSANATLSRTRVENNKTEGILVLGAATLAIDDGVVSGSQYNVDVYTLTASTVRLTIARSLIERGGYGVYLEPNSFDSLVYAFISDSTISGHSLVGVALSSLQGLGEITSVTRCQILHNAVGIKGEGTATGFAWMFLDATTVQSSLPSTSIVFDQTHAIVFTRSNNVADITVTNGAMIQPVSGS